jgi:hypothetical protein
MIAAKKNPSRPTARRELPVSARSTTNVNVPSIATCRALGIVRMTTDRAKRRPTKNWRLPTCGCGAR